MGIVSIILQPKHSYNGLSEADKPSSWRQVWYIYRDWSGSRHSPVKWQVKTCARWQEDQGWYQTKYLYLWINWNFKNWTFIQPLNLNLNFHFKIWPLLCVLMKLTYSVSQWSLLSMILIVFVFSSWIQLCPPPCLYHLCFYLIYIYYKARLLWDCESVWTNLYSI